MSLDLDILQEEKYMSPTLRQILKMRDRQFGEDDSFFVRLFPYEDRIAMLNNYEASKYARGYVPDVHYKLLNSNLKNLLITILKTFIKFLNIIELSVELSLQIPTL
jgi:hypothetical protein